MNAKQAPTPTAATITPPAAGPTTRAALKRLELSAIALGSSSRPTIWNVSACRAGASSTRTMPRSAVSRYTSWTVTTPPSVSPVSAKARSMEAVWVPITVLLASIRSTSTPANSPSTVNGRNWKTARMPTATGEWVISSTSQAVAMFCIQVPLTEITWPEKKRR